MALAILRLPIVKSRTGLSRSTIYLRISEGRFPAPVSLGSRAVGWIESEIQGWLEDRIQASRSRTVSHAVPRQGRGCVAQEGCHAELHR